MHTFGLSTFSIAAIVMLDLGSFITTACAEAAAARDNTPDSHCVKLLRSMPTIRNGRVNVDCAADAEEELLFRIRSHIQNQVELSLASITSFAACSHRSSYTI